MYVHFFTIDETTEEWYGPFYEVWFEGLGIHVREANDEEHIRDFAHYDTNADSPHDWVSPAGISYVDMEIVSHIPDTATANTY